MATSRDDFEKNQAKSGLSSSEKISQDINGRSNPNWNSPKNTSASNGGYVDGTSTGVYVNPTRTAVGSNNLNYPGSPTYSNNSSIVNAMADMSGEVANYNVVDRYDVDWYTRFNRFGFMDPFNSIKNSREYIFITKPDLNLFSGSVYNPNPRISESSTFFSDALDRYRDVAAQLQYSVSRDDGPFIQILSNTVTGGLELPEINANTIETASNVYGTHLSYRGGSAGSDKDFDFTLEFKDSRYLEVYMLFKMYDEYERMKWVGQVSPNEEYVRNRILHDQVSIYKIIVGEDGMSILYWARAMGCMPLSVPRSSMINLTEDPTYSISWKAQWVSDMDPKILVDFNTITADYRSRSNGDLPLYNTTSHTAEGRWSLCPYVKTRTSTSTRKEKLNKYYLFWAY